MKKTIKKTIIVFLILILTISTSILSLFKIKKTSSFCLCEIKNIEQNLSKDNKRQLLKKILKLEENWQKNASILRICLKREPLEKLDLEFLKLKNNIKNFNENKVEKNIKTMAYLFEQIEKDSKPVFFNIF